VRYAISTRDGFISIKDEVNADEMNGDWCASILLEFENHEKLNAWAAAPEHEALVDNLDIYRTRPWKTRWDSPGSPTAWFNGPEISSKTSKGVDSN